MAELARRMVTLRSARYGGSWKGSWNGSPDDPSVVSAISAIITDCDVSGRVELLRPVNESAPRGRVA